MVGSKRTIIISVKNTNKFMKHFCVGASLLAIAELAVASKPALTGERMIFTFRGGASRNDR